jgi:hypothetical protein
MKGSTLAEMPMPLSLMLILLRLPHGAAWKIKLSPFALVPL